MLQFLSFALNERLLKLWLILEHHLKYQNYLVDDAHYLPLKIIKESLGKRKKVVKLILEENYYLLLKESLGKRE